MGASGTLGGPVQLRLVSPRERLARVWIVLAAAVTASAFLDLRGFEPAERSAFDLRRAVFTGTHRSGPGRALKEIVLVTITDDTFRTLSGPPLPRSCHTKIIRDLTAAGARVIAWDLRFETPTPYDAGLARAARESGRVLWGCAVDDKDQPEEKRRLILPTALLRRENPNYVHLHVEGQPRVNIFDAVEPVVRHPRGEVTALSVRAALMGLGLEQHPLTFEQQQWRAGPLTIPVDQRGHFKITYFGPPETTFPSVPYEAVYSGSVAPAFFRNKIIIIGDASVGNNDYKATPVGWMPGVEMHAHAIATLLDRAFVAEAPLAWNVGAMILLAGLACLLAGFWPLQWAAVSVTAAMAAYFVGNVWLFCEHRIWLHLVAPEAAAGLATTGILLVRAWFEERHKNLMRGLLQRHLSPQIAEYVIAHPHQCTLGRVTATVLFSDIRGFTPLSERLQPEEVVERLNEYLQAMTDVIFRHDGAVDKYIGDAIMALFGAPIRQPDHARRAVATAIDMQSALLELRSRWEAQGLPLIDIGIGINTGEMVVGYMGAQQRSDFSAIGDAVNVAARIEGANKELGSRILITAETHAFVENEVLSRGPLEIRVKGKEEPVIVYEILGWR